MILNLMLGRKSGGLEQAAVDYAEAMRLAGIDALTVTAPNAWVNTHLDAAKVTHQSLPQLGAWDPLAALRLRRIAQKTNATAVICHGNRALKIALRAFPKNQAAGTKHQAPKIIAVAHNYHTKHFHRADAWFCITEHARRQLMGQGMAAERLFLMPNMVRIPEIGGRGAVVPPPTIGTMGRFVEKKGFEVYIEALAILKSLRIPFRAVLGGGGEMEAELRALIHARGLENDVTMTGWVKDKVAFFAGLDVFALPSHHEPFGIVLIEAMAHGVPVVSTAVEGPVEIIRQGLDGLLVPRAEPQAMAAALASLIRHESDARAMAASARARVETEYSMEAMAQRLRNVGESLMWAQVDCTDAGDCAT